MTPRPAEPVCWPMRTVWIGTSGWVYKEWAGHFYPEGWPKKDEFRYYAQHFPTVEINATFYRLPSKKMVRGWREKSPEGFVYAVKGSRYLTHIRRLNDTSKGLQKYFRRLVPLGDRTGPILWQLPPNFQKNADTFKRLSRFLARLPTQYRHAIEFRHPSWMDEETFALLRQHRAANVWISSLRMPAAYTITTDFVYLRFHGLKDGAYHDYTDAELAPWAKQLARAARRGIPAYVYFNNDLNTRAPLNADALMRQLKPFAVRALAADAATRMPELPPPVKGPETWPSWTRPGKKAAAAGPAVTRANGKASGTRKRTNLVATNATAARPRRARSSRDAAVESRSTRRPRKQRTAARARDARFAGVATAPARTSERRFAAAQFSEARFSMAPTSVSGSPPGR